MTINRYAPSFWTDYGLTCNENGKFLVVQPIRTDEKVKGVAALLERLSEINGVTKLSEQSVRLLEKHLPTFPDPSEEVAEKIKILLRRCEVKIMFGSFLESLSGGMEQSIWIEEIEKLSLTKQADLYLSIDYFTSRVGWKKISCRLPEILKEFSVDEVKRYVDVWHPLFKEFNNLTDVEEVFYGSRMADDNELPLYAANCMTPFLGKIYTASRFYALIRFEEEGLVQKEKEIFLEILGDELKEVQPSLVEVFLCLPRKEFLSICRTLLELTRKTEISIEVFVHWWRDLKTIVDLKSTFEAALIRGSSEEQLMVFLEDLDLQRASFENIMAELELSTEDMEQFTKMQRAAKEFAKDWQFIQANYPSSLFERLIYVYDNFLGIDEGPKHPITVYQKIQIEHQKFYRIKGPVYQVEMNGALFRIRWNIKEAQQVYKRKIENRQITTGEFFKWIGQEKSAFFAEFLRVIEEDLDEMGESIYHLRQMISEPVCSENIVDSKQMQLALLIQHANRIEDPEKRLVYLHEIAFKLNTCPGGWIEGINDLYRESVQSRNMASNPFVTADRPVELFVWDQYASWVSSIVSDEKGEFFRRVLGKKADIQEPMHQVMYIKNRLSKHLGNYLWKPQFDPYTGVIEDVLFNLGLKDLMRHFFVCAEIFTFVDTFIQAIKEHREGFMMMEELFDEIKLPRSKRWIMTETEVTLSHYGACKALERLGVITIEEGPFGKRRSERLARLSQHRRVE